MSSKWFQAFWVVLCVAVCGGMQGQQTGASFNLEGLDNRPYRLSTFHPLTNTLALLEEGQVGMKGQIKLTWPDDGRVHFLELECAGIVWSLPVCGPYVQGATLRVPPLGGAPFSARQGSVYWAPEEGLEWTPIVVSQAQEILAEIERETAADMQQSMLWSGVSSQANDGGVLGIPIGQGPSEDVNQDSLWTAHQTRFQKTYGDLLNRCSLGAERDYLAALQWRLLPELYPDSAQVWRAAWCDRDVPHPDDAGGVEVFLQGLNRVAGFDGWSMAEKQSLRRALVAGDLDSLAAATAVWWGGEDVDKTLAWFLSRLGDGGLGVQFPQRFDHQVAVPNGVHALLTECLDHPLLGTAAQRLIEKCTHPGALPASLRAFAASGSLMRMEELAGSGPVAWLWLDASAPTTVVQLQVLERMMTSQGGQGRRGQSVSRDLKWVVADVGQDWTAFEQLIRDAAARHGGLQKLPYTMLHTGGDVRWTEAFELQTLPAMRHSGPGLVPTPEAPPMPGPALIGWLAKRS